MRTLVALSLNFLFVFAVAEDLKDQPKNLLKPTNKVESWNFEQHEGGKGTITAEGDTIVFDVKEVTGTDWHVQCYQWEVDLKEGTSYTVSFEMKGSGSKSVSCVAGLSEEDWHEVGLHEDLYATKEFKKYEFTFRAESVSSKKMNRIGFVLGADRGSITVKDFKLVEKVKK
jgi:hypothetical protein